MITIAATAFSAEPFRATCSIAGSFYQGSPCSKQYIDIVGWEKIGYEIRYSFLREKDKAVFKTFVNGKYEFRNAHFTYAKSFPSSTFNNTLAEILNHLPNVSIKRNTAETIISQIEFDFELEEEFPFTRSLFDELVLLFKKQILRLMILNISNTKNAIHLSEIMKQPL
ncbi:MAG: hypothetical protein IPN13_12625 [Bacteroidetes bacterium]|nr:hypothetical protein [Bacteroidota bacterium]